MTFDKNNWVIAINKHDCHEKIDTEWGYIPYEKWCRLEIIRRDNGAKLRFSKDRRQCWVIQRDIIHEEVKEKSLTEIFGKKKYVPQMHRGVEEQ